MKIYVVTRTFTDLQDGNYRYVTGATYPRPGVVPSKKRVQELSSPDNRLGMAVIEEVPEEASPLPEEASETRPAAETAPEAPKPKRRAKKG